MAAVDVRSEEEPSARTVSAVLDAAAERIAAAGVENARADAEALVADAMGVKPEQPLGRQRRRGPGRGRRGDRGAGGAPGRPRADGLHPRPRSLPRPRDRRRQTGALAAPRDRAAGRGRRRAARGRPRPRGRHRLRARSPWRCSPSGRTCGSPPPTSRRRRSKRRARTPSGSASTSTSASPPASPTASRASTWSSPTFPTSPTRPSSSARRRSRRSRGSRSPASCGEDGLGVIRGLIAETPSGWKLAMEHDTHHGPAMREMLRDATTLQDYEGDERVTVGFAP